MIDGEFMALLSIPGRSPSDRCRLGQNESESASLKSFPPFEHRYGINYPVSSGTAIGRDLQRKAVVPVMLFIIYALSVRAGRGTVKKRTGLLAPE